MDMKMRGLVTKSDTTHLRWLQLSPEATAKVLKVCGRKAEVLQVSFGPFRFDPHNGLWRGTREVPLPPRAVGVLAALVAQAGITVSKQTLLVAIVFALFGQHPPEPRPTVRFSITLPDITAIDPLHGSIAVSPDGTRMVYVATNLRQVALRAKGDPTSWSADGRLLAFTQYHPVTGADVQLLDVRTRERRALVRMPV